ncbi:MAG: crossover junction endodeoxyribonuclease RuvC [Alphaproteobacteria bacterium]|nr:crossover junction endodeoxyribonuclease RuvC [Alphaproteobacteria bacterium]
MLVLGIDPGSTVTGYGLVDRHRGRYQMVTAGVIKTSSKDPVPHRLREIHEGLVAVLTVHRPQAIAIEAIFRHKSSESALKLGQARGVALLAAAQANLPVFEYNAMTIKKSVTGTGRADKKQIARVVSMLLGQEVDLPHDATDALAIGITHLAHARHHASLRGLK